MAPGVRLATLDAEIKNAVLMMGCICSPKITRCKKEVLNFVFKKRKH